MSESPPAEDWQTPDPPLSSRVQREIRREIAAQVLHPYDDMTGAAVPPTHPDGMDTRKAINDQDIRDRNEVRHGPETPRETAERIVAEDAATDVVDTLKALREMQGAEGAVFRVHRIGYADGSPLRHAPNGEVCGEIGASQLDPIIIGNLYGGGKYRVRGRYTNGQFAGERTIVIAADFKGPTSMMSQQPAPAAAPFNFAEFQAAQEARDERRRREEDERRERREEAEEKRRADRQALILAALASPGLAAIIAAFTSNRGPDIGALIAAAKGPSVTELMTLVKDLQPPPVREPPDAMDRALKLMDAIQARTPQAPGDGGGGISDVLRGLLPLLASLPVPGSAAAAQSSQSSQPAMSVQAQPPAALSGAVASVSSADPAGGSDMNLALLPLLGWFKGQIGAMLARAAKGVAPALAAEIFIADFPDGVNPDTVVSLLESSDWWQRLQQFEPRVAPYGAWFASMRAEVLKQVQELRQEAATGAGPGISGAGAARAAQPSETGRPAGPPDLFKSPV